MRTPLLSMGLAAAALGAPSLAGAAPPVSALPPAHPPAITEVAPGVGYQRVVKGDGTVVHVVRAAASPRVALAPVLAGGSPTRRGSLTGAVAARLDSGAVAGINGDFFNTTTNDPSGVLMIGGELIKEPEASRSALVLLPGGGLDAVALALQGRYQALDPSGAQQYSPRTVSGINRPAKRGSETILYTPAYGSLTTPVAGSRYEVRVRLDRRARWRPTSRAPAPRSARARAGAARSAPAMSCSPGWARRARHWSPSSPSAGRVGITPGCSRCPPAPPAPRRRAACWCATARPSRARARASRARRPAADGALGRRPDRRRHHAARHGRGPPAGESRGVTVAEQALAAAVARGPDRHRDGRRRQRPARRARPSWSSPGRAPRSLSDVVLLMYTGRHARAPALPAVAERRPRGRRARPWSRAPPSPASTRVTSPAGPAARPSGSGRAVWARAPRACGSTPAGLQLARRRLRRGGHHTADDGSGVTEQRRRVIVRPHPLVTQRPRRSARVGGKASAASTCASGCPPARVTARVETAGTLCTGWPPARCPRPGRPRSPGIDRPAESSCPAPCA